MAAGTIPTTPFSTHNSLNETLIANANLENNKASVLTAKWYSVDHIFQFYAGIKTPPSLFSNEVRIPQASFHSNDVPLKM